MNKAKARIESYQDLIDYINKEPDLNLEWMPSQVCKDMAKIVVMGQNGPVQEVVRKNGKEEKVDNYCVRFKGPGVLHPKDIKLTPSDKENLIAILGFPKSLFSTS